MDTKLKAIETRYKGYRFRSRLEARWAVFFDTLGVRYEYEKEGFVLLGGLTYLPDFWLPDFRLWVEIKPVNDFDESWEKSYHLPGATGFDCLYICGQPWPNEYAITEMKVDPEGPWDGWFEAEFAECRRCDGLCLLESENGWSQIGPHTCGNAERWPLYGADAPRLSAAYKAAREARFEHGEKP